MKLSKDLLVRLSLTSASLILFSLVFWLAYPYAGLTAATLNFLPAIICGWLLGWRGGVVFILIAIPVNVFLFRLVGNYEAIGLSSFLLGGGVNALVSIGVGLFHDLHQRVKKQSEALQAEIERRIQAEERLTYEALHDPLTNLANRRLLITRLEHAFETSQRCPEKLSALLYLDLDRFKSVNDTLGHAAGDRVLIEVANRLKYCVRAVDIVARMGGDEFAVLVEDAAGPENVQAIVLRIEENLALPHTWGYNSVVSEASIGVVMGLTAYSQVDEILREADLAMYRAKAGKRNL